MADTRFARRRFVLFGIAAASVAAVPHRWLPGSMALADSKTTPDLPQLARRLFPHNGLADDVYVEVAESVLDSFVANPDSAKLLDIAGSALDAQVDGNWIDVDEDRQVAALKSIESETFFGTILASLRGVFYNHPKVWAHINYPGSSKEFGGYKYRGFNDIEWLPEVDR